MGGMLSLQVAGNAYEVAADNPGLRTFIFAALFPLNLVIIMLTGGLLFTGATFVAPLAVLESKATIAQALRVIIISWLGNLCGGIIFALFCDWSVILFILLVLSFISRVS